MKMATLYDEIFEDQSIEVKWTDENMKEKVR